MDKDRIRQSVERILEMPQADRRAAIAREAAGDAEFAAALEKALRDATEFAPGTPHPGSGSASRGAAWRAAESLVPGEEISDGSSHYRLRKRLVGGNLGEVWMAEQTAPVQRVVAMKFIRDDRLSKETMERFERERRVLAHLDHQNIARYYAAGTYRDKPWFAMEFVEGDTIDVYCRRNTLTVEERIRLVQQVARAVQYAHSREVVHRDLKPSNIVVSNKGVPKLLDFGIAKIVGESRRITLGSEPRTPDYASPEQLDNKDSTTHTDVYALGVILYELLTDQLPHHVGTRVREAIRDLKRLEPPPPMSKALDEVEDDEQGGSVTPASPATPAGGSAPTPATSGSGSASSARRSGSRTGRRRHASRRLVEIARSRSTRPDRLIRQLQGNLDNIVLKAMRVEPLRRYSSPEALAEDLENHLQGLPVAALPESAAARLSRALVRNRWAVAGSLVTMVAVVGVLLATTFKLRYDTTQQENTILAQKRNRIEMQRSVLREAFERVSKQIDEQSSRSVRDAGDIQRLRDTLVNLESEYTQLAQSGGIDAETVDDWIQTGDTRRRLSALADSPANRTVNAGNAEESAVWAARAQAAAQRAIDLAGERGDALPLKALELMAALARDRGDRQLHTAGNLESAESSYQEAAKALDRAIESLRPGAPEGAALQRERRTVATKLADVATESGRKEGLVAARAEIVRGYREELSRSQSALARIDLSIGLLRLGETMEFVDGRKSPESHQCFEDAVEVMRPALDASAGVAVRRAAGEAMQYLADRLMYRSDEESATEDQRERDRSRARDLVVEATRQAAILAYQAPQEMRSREDLLQIQQMLLPWISGTAALKVLDMTRVVRIEPDMFLLQDEARIPAETAEIIGRPKSLALRIAYSNRLAHEWDASQANGASEGVPDAAKVKFHMAESWPHARAVAGGAETDLALVVEAMYCLALAGDPDVSALLWPAEPERAANITQSVELARSLRERVAGRKSELVGAIYNAEYFASERVSQLEPKDAAPAPAPAP